MIILGRLVFFIYLESLDRKYLTILVVLLMKSTKILVMRILVIVLAFSITNARSSHPVFLINANVYVRFGLVRSGLYI